jgi:XTP/dITP diphosphohydrolase
MTHAIALGTANRGKVEELRALFARFRGPAIRVYSLDELVRQRLTIIESGKTFAENAIIKARAVAQATMMLTVADDSGLEVDALEGRPGVRSARFAHERATDAENNAALLAALEATGDGAAGADEADRLKARFRCALALVDPYSHDGEPIVVEGTCEGAITRAPRGSGGFGYDPLFVVAGLDRTMAELTEAEKNTMSHRARAVAALMPVLERVLRERDALVDRIEARI